MEMFKALQFLASSSHQTCDSDDLQNFVIMPTLEAREIAIIGAGPCGLAAAKYLLAEKYFSRLDIFEQSSRVGGVWNYTGDIRGTSATGIANENEEGFRVPQTDVHVELERPRWRRKRKIGRSDKGESTRDGEVMAKPAQLSTTPSRSTPSARSSSLSPSELLFREDAKAPIATPAESTTENLLDTDVEPVFPTPMYEQLETNIPRTLMCFSDLSFPTDCQLFPKHQAVKEYIDEYAKELLPLVRFESQVRDVRLLEASGNDNSGDGSKTSEIIKEKWLLKVEELRTGRLQERNYDAVVIANGHYSVPYVPDIEGAREWNEMFPGTLTHSKSFRKAEEFLDKKVIIIGNSASGLDIGRQISRVCKTPLIVSQRSPSDLGPTTSTQIDETPPILRFIPGDDRSVLFANGRIESNIDAILFCTGYLYSYPMLSSLYPQPITDGVRVEHTYEHLIYAPHPSLTFMALPQKVIPFPIAEAQAAVVARLYSGRLELPSQEAMKEWERETLKRKAGVPRRFHVLPFPEDGQYINRLLDWAAEADAAAAAHAMRARNSSSERLASVTICMQNGKMVEGETIGKTRPKWGKREFWIRERFTVIRKAFLAKGEERHGVRTLEELGFRFEGGIENRVDGRGGSLGVDGDGADMTGGGGDGGGGKGKA